MTTFSWGNVPDGVTLTPIQEALIRALVPIFADEIRNEAEKASDRNGDAPRDSESREGRLAAAWEAATCEQRTTAD